MSRNRIFYLDDVLESARKISRYTDGLTFDKFRSQDMVIDAVVRNLEIIGEAAKHLPTEARDLMPDVDWSKAIGFRDVIAHGYFGLDLHIIWDVVQTKIPAIKQSTERTLKELKHRP